MQQKYVEVLCFCYVHLEPHANAQVTIIYVYYLHDQPCIEVVYLEFNTLHGTRIYAHSSAKVYFVSCHSDYDINVTAMLYIQRVPSIILCIIHISRNVYLSYFAAQ